MTDLPDPVPQTHEYLIQVHASATNFFDLLQIRGKYQHQPKLPWVAGAEFSGVVLKAPDSLPKRKTPKFKAGDKVFGSGQGGYATKIVASEERLRPIPNGWSFFDAAGLFVTAPTSYGGLVTRAGIKRGNDIERNFCADTELLQATGSLYTQQQVVLGWRRSKSQKPSEPLSSQPPAPSTSSMSHAPSVPTMPSITDKRPGQMRSRSLQAGEASTSCTIPSGWSQSQ